ncbi:hypothetical protein, partial [Plasmodium yoelii yoelii]
MFNFEMKFKSQICNKKWAQFVNHNYNELCIS